MKKLYDVMRKITKVYLVLSTAVGIASIPFAAIWYRKTMKSLTTEISE